jgi:hypothetical protein
MRKSFCQIAADALLMRLVIALISAVSVLSMGCGAREAAILSFVLHSSFLGENVYKKRGDAQ